MCSRRRLARCGQEERHIQLLVDTVPQRAGAIQRCEPAYKERRIGLVVSPHPLDPFPGVVQVLLQRAALAEERQGFERPGESIDALELVPIDA